MPPAHHHNTTISRGRAFGDRRGTHTPPPPRPNPISIQNLLSISTSKDCFLSPAAPRLPPPPPPPSPLSLTSHFTSLYFSHHLLITAQIHHDKHHAAYVNNLNAALSKFPELACLGLVDLNKAAGSDKVPAAVSKAVINQGGGALNHALFWEWMAKPTDSNKGPSPALKGAIEAAFGSVDELKAAFDAAAASVFGSGWAWLVLKSDGKLAVTTTPNQVNPLMASVVAADAGIPILGLDVWEHAYYLKYQNKRPEYIASWWNVVNWERASAAYEAGLKGEVLL